MKPRSLFLAAALLVAGATGAQAQAAAPSSGADHAAHHPAPAQASASLSEGEVRKVDKEQGKLTLRHGPLENLGMPPMTMVFKVSDAKLLEGLAQGDKVKFTADKVNGAYTVTALQKAN